jgi:regulator of sigma E protease
MLLEKIAIFIIFLGPLVFFHELGHFLFARLFGVRVEVFSIGFGPKLFRKKWGDTEYAFSLIPLGGYVKMFGDDPLAQDELTEAEKKVAYTSKGKWARFCIVFGGPLANFILAFFLYYGLVVVGEKVPEARFGNIPVNTRFYDIGLRSGDILKKINAQEILSFDDLNMIDSEVKSLLVMRNNQEVKLDVDFIGTQFLMDFSSYRGELRAPFLLGADGVYYILSNSDQPNFQVSLESFDNSSLQEVFLLPVQNNENPFTKVQKMVTEENPDYSFINIDHAKVKNLKLNRLTSPLQQIIAEKFYPLDLVVESIVMGSPADKAKLAQGDIVIAINGVSLANFEDLRTQIQKTEANVDALVTIMRKGQLQDLKLMPEYKEVNGQKVLTIGVYSGIIFQPIRMVESKASGLGDGLFTAYNRTLDGMHKTLLGFKKLITAEVSLNNIGGPLAIGKVASDSFNISLSMFFRLMAIISINLGIINLFPIPVLDGGHIVFIFLELINGGPLSRKKLQIAQQFGMSLLFLLIFVALFNDISRFF